MDKSEEDEELRRQAYDVVFLLNKWFQSILNEVQKRKSLSEMIGSEAYYTVMFFCAFYSRIDIVPPKQIQIS